MTQTPLLEQAHQGKPQAIAHLINRSLQKQGVTASVESEHGFLEVMLEATQVPNETLAAFVHQGLLKLKIEAVYEVSVYGRKAGEHFATWSQQFQLQPRPVTDFVANFTPTLPSFEQPSQPTVAQPRPITLSFATEDGGIVRLDIALILGILGSILIIFGAFTPIFNVPIVGGITFFKNGSEEGYALIGCAIASIVFLLKKRYAFLWASALGATGLVTLVFLIFQMRMYEMRSSLDADLADNPFRGLADAAVGAVQLQWGWIVLILGCVTLLFATYLKQRKPSKETYIALAAAISLLIAVAIILPSIQYAGQAVKAKESEARTYVGSMNRAQQAYYLENDKFSWQIEDLGLGIATETTNYRYQITAADKGRTISVGTAKRSGIKSYVGGVFVIPDSSDITSTVSILCQSDRATQSPVAPPTLNGTEPHCASGSSKLD
jgi:type II secretory pathway pseudopilin PulG